MKPNKSISWPLLILVIICLPPLGIFLLVSKYSSNRSLLFASSLILKLLAAVTIIYGVAVFVYLYNFEVGFDSPLMLALLGFVVVAAAFYNSGIKAKKESDKYKLYIEAVANRSLRDVREIAEFTADTYQQALLVLGNMITIGYFKRAFIDYDNGLLVFVDTVPVPEEPAVNIAHKTITCNSCGAHASILHDNLAHFCEYCDSPLP